jgi:hypothetical protein
MITTLAFLVSTTMRRQASGTTGSVTTTGVQAAICRAIQLDWQVGLTQMVAADDIRFRLLIRLDWGEFARVSDPNSLAFRVGRGFCWPYVKRAVILQAYLGSEGGVGPFVGVGVEAGVSYSECPTPSGKSESSQARASFNFGAGESVGASVEGPLPWSNSVSGGASTGVGFGRLRLGAGAGLQLSGGASITTTYATSPFWP